MLFGGANPWMGGRQRRRQPSVPQVQPPQQAQVVSQQPFQPAPVSWPQPTPDMDYANNLAQFYASQMPNQQVPGSAPIPAFTQGPTGSPYSPPPATAPAPLPGNVGNGGDWLDAFRQARHDWRMAKPDDRNLLANWRMARPNRFF